MSPVHLARAIACTGALKAPQAREAAALILSRLQGPPAAPAAASAADGKGWATLVARAALRGFTLLRTDPADGRVRYFAERLGDVRELRTVEDIEGVL